MVERAYINDIAALTALRLEFLQEDCGELNEEVISKLAEALPAYFEKNLNHNKLERRKMSLPVHSC